MVKEIGIEPAKINPAESHAVLDIWIPMRQVMLTDEAEFRRWLSGTMQDAGDRLMAAYRVVHRKR